MKITANRYILLLTVLTMLWTGTTVCGADFSTRDLNEESILAVSWVQNSAEFKALALQAFNMARLRWDMDEEDDKKCVVVDVDETILDNSPYQAGLIGRDFGYGNTTWKEWCDAATARAIPGAIEFLKHVVKTGGEVFYITNRKAMPKKNMDLTEGTMKNLKALGFPNVDRRHLLLRTGMSQKQSRRNKVSWMGYRTVLFIGDNLTDFDEAFDGDTMAERHKAVELNKDKFGLTFIMLPNPMYGHWEGALYGGGRWYKKTARERSDIRKQELRKFNFSK